jgi:hypothetical protein
MNNYHIVDTPWKTTEKIPCLKQNGIQTVIRYYNFVNSKALPQKRLELPEAKALSAAGFQIAVVFQAVQNRRSDFSKDKGVAAGKRAWEIAKKNIGQPNGSTIYFAVDFDASTTDIDGFIVPYFEGVQSAMKELGMGKSDYKIGAYGSGLVVNELLQRGLIEFRWLSMSSGFRGTKKAIEEGKYELRQIVPATTLCGIGVDYNEKKTPNTDIGSFSI